MKTRISFSEVCILGFKSIRDSSGKIRKYKKKFFQTLSPFNTTCQGRPKTREEIMRELNRERELWIAKEGI
jgi:hypothetical protein